MCARKTLSIGIVIVAGIALLAAPVSAELSELRAQWWTGGSPGVDSLNNEVNGFLGNALASGDFNCDGFDDLAVGVPGHTVDGHAAAGAVLVLFGGEAGLVPAEHQLWSQDSTGIEEIAEAGDRFGDVLAAGDFDGDGCSDLAVGAWNEDVDVLGSPELQAGAVHVLYGSIAGGLSSAGDQLFTASETSILGGSQASEFFGQALAAGDLDNDGFDDLAIGVPGAGTAAGSPNQGRVELFYGSPTGVHPDVDWQGLSRSLAEIPGGPQVGERFGQALAFGRFAESQRWLAIGGPGRDDNGAALSGAVVLWRPALAGPPDAIELLQSQADVPGVEGTNDNFGAALAAGSFDGDSHHDLAIGIPQKVVDGLAGAGAVTVMFLAGASSSQLIDQDDFFGSGVEAHDNFGRALAAGDFDGDGADDLAVGVPSELEGVDFAGAVNVVHGALGVGLDLGRTQTWNQTLDATELGDTVGSSLAVGRFAGHSGADLAFGAPGENLPGASDAGAVTVLYTVNLFADGFDTGDTSAWDIVVE